MANKKPATEHIENASTNQEPLPILDTSAAISMTSLQPHPPSSSREDTLTISPNPSNNSQQHLSKEKGASKVTVRSITQSTSPKASKQSGIFGHARRWYLTLEKSSEERWIFEISCCVFATINLLAIITALAVRQERSVPHWPYAITVNSLISIFTSLMKAAMMLVVSSSISQMKWQWFDKPHPLADVERFDSAARGPWGAFTLMLKVRAHYLASLGAFITVMALAIDPFSQQIIQYYPCSEPLPGSEALLPRTNNYTFGGFLSKPGYPGYAELDSTMAAAMYLGTIDPPLNPSATIPFQCSTGNCTFPASQNATASTLGMCYSTMDLTHYIQKNTTLQDRVGYWLPDLSWGNFNDSKYAEDKVGVSSPGGSGPSQSIITVANSNYQMLATKKGIANGPGFSPGFDDLFTFDTLMLNVNSSCDVLNGDIHLSETCEKHPWAVRISLYPCIKTFQSSITNSLLNETLISTTPLRKTNVSAIEITTSPGLTYSLATDTILVNGTWKTCQTSDHYTVLTPVPISSIKKTLRFSPEEPTTWYPAECVWMLDYVPGLAINQFLSWMYDESPLIAVAENTVITSGSTWLKPLYLNGTADMGTVIRYTDGLASGMTGIMRQRGSNPVSGTVLASQTCIHVGWEWLGLPAGLVLFTIILLTCTLIKCRLSNMWESTRSWRDSSLALLFHGCDDGVRDRTMDVAGKRDMEHVSDSLVVEFVRTEKGLRFIERASA